MFELLPPSDNYTCEANSQTFPSENNVLLKELFTSYRKEMLAGSGEAPRALTVDCANSKLVPPVGPDVLQHGAVLHGLGEGSERL